jgi:5-methylcytosine-specific restriction endonuclease McrA
MCKPVGAGQQPANSETLEHLRRKANGGSDGFDNLALACRDCNVGRGNLDWLTYKSMKMGELGVVA